MNRTVSIIAAVALWLAAPMALLALQAQSSPPVQSCAPDEAIVSSMKQDLATLVGTVKKESLDDFQRAFHQQSCMSRLSICLHSVDDLLTCLDKSSHDAGATKGQSDSAKSKQDTYTKLKTAMQAYVQKLKGTTDAKAAKAAIEQFDFTH
jgi:hypothetical protein